MEPQASTSYPFVGSDDERDATSQARSRTSSFLADVAALLDSLPTPSVPTAISSRADAARSRASAAQRRVRTRLAEFGTNMQEMRRRVLTGSPTQRVRDAVGKRMQSTMENQVYPRVRKLVTGDADTSVEVFMSKPPVVKMTDRILFTMSVLFVILSEYIFVRYPEHVWLLYSCAWVPMALFRIKVYRAKGWGYFLYDFCYIFSASLFVNLVFFPTNSRWLRANFILATGPIAMSIIAWRNQMVFHSVDKMISLFVHLFPSLVMFSLRWHPQSVAIFGSASPLCDINGARPFCTPDAHGFASLGIISGLARPTLIYALWQALQIIKTEFIDAAYLRAHPEVYTSIRWIAKDQRNGMNIATLNCMRATRFMSRDEKHSPDSLKSKLAMWFFQAVFYFVNSGFAYIAFHSFYFNVVYLVFIIAMSIWNGASYYVNVFTVRYQSQFVTPEDAADNEEVYDVEDDPAKRS